MKIGKYLIAMLMITSVLVFVPTTQAATITIIGAAVQPTTFVVGGSPGSSLLYTYDGNTNTYITLQESTTGGGEKTGMLQFYWSAEYTLTSFEVYINNFQDTDKSHIAGIMYRTAVYDPANPWSDLTSLNTDILHPTNNVWTNIVDENPTCYGIAVIIHTIENYWINPEWKDTRVAGISPNDPPEAEFAWLPDFPTVGQDITFDASLSTGANDYQWQWTTGGTWTAYQTDPVIHHTYATAASYQVSMRARNSYGTDVVTHTVVVSDLPNNNPTCSGVSGPSSAVQNIQAGVFTAAVDDVEDPDALQVMWDWGDGTAQTYGTEGDYDEYHTWTTAGTYNVRARCKDPDGGVSSWSPNHAVNVQAGGTGLVAYFSYTVSGKIASFDASQSTGETQYRWDWESDGTWDTPYSTQAQTSHTYAADGTYSVTLQVKDATEATDDYSDDVVIGGGTGTTHEVTITVVDVNGDPVEGAEVQLRDGTMYTDETNTQGIATFPTVAEDIYILTVSCEGYTIFEDDSLYVTATSNNDHEITLEKGLDITMLVIGIVVGIIILSIFGGIGIVMSPPFRYIMLIVGIILAIVFIYLIGIMNLFGSLMG